MLTITLLCKQFMPLHEYRPLPETCKTPPIHAMSYYLLCSMRNSINMLASFLL